MLVDTHCHLNFEPLSGDLPGVLERAFKAGVEKVVVPAYDPSSWDTIAKLCDHKRTYPALGLHPWVADKEFDIDRLKRLLTDSRAIAIGEIGLDFKIDNVERQRQLDVFTKQLDLAIELDLPVLLHCRGAFEEMLEILSGYAPDLRGVIHAFSRGPQLAQRFVDLGFYMAFGGAITRLRAKQARRSAQVVPEDRLLLETDAPSIGLEGVEPENVEPRHVREIALSLARLREVEFEFVVEKTGCNAKRLFGF